MIGASLLFWGVFATIQGAYTYLSMLSHGHSLLRLIAYEWLVFLFWVAATPLIAVLARRHSLIPWRWSAAGVHAAVATALASAHVLWLVAMQIAVRPYDERTMLDFGASAGMYFPRIFPFSLLIYLATLGAIHAFEYYERSRERALRAAALERELARARLDVLAAQLQPHFLFNALHTVTGLIRGREYEEAVTTIAGLSDLLRYALDTREGQEARLADELAATKHYLAIQELRHGDRLTVTLDVAPETLATRVPRLLLQPLVENAIRHGVAPTSAPAWLTVRASRLNGSLHIEVANSTPAGHGGGEGLGIGLRNTRERLDGLYGDATALEVRRGDDRFEVVLDLPWRDADAGGGRG